MTQLATSIRIARGRRGWTQARLAKEAGVSISVVAGVECGRTAEPTATSLVRLADALGLDPESLSPTSDASAEQSEAGPRAIRENQQSPASKDATAPRGAQVSTTAPTVEANAAGKAA